MADKDSDPENSSAWKRSGSGNGDGDKNDAQRADNTNTSAHTRNADQPPPYTPHVSQFAAAVPVQGAGGGGAQSLWVGQVKPRARAGAAINKSIRLRSLYCILLLT